MPLRDECNDCRDSAGLSLGRRQHCLGFYAEKLHLGEKTEGFVVIAKLIICRVVLQMLNSQRSGLYQLLYQLP